MNDEFNLIKSISTILTKIYMMLKYKHCFYGALKCGKFAEDGHILDLVHHEKNEEKIYYSSYRI